MAVMMMTTLEEKGEMAVVAVKEEGEQDEKEDCKEHKIK